MILKEPGAGADSRQNRRQVLIEVLRGCDEPQCKSSHGGRRQHRPPSRPQDEDCHRALDQLDGDRCAKCQPAPPATGHPAPQPHPGEGEQDEIDLAFVDVAHDRLKGKRDKHQQHGQLRVVHPQDAERTEQEDGERCVENQGHPNRHQVAVHADQRLQEPREQRRHDVLRACRLETTYAPAKVIRVAVRSKPARRSHVALAKVADVRAEDDRQQKCPP